MSTAAPVIEARSLAVSYGHVRALAGLSFSAGRGDLILVLGSNGAGKSSLVNSLAGLVPATAGDVFVDGARVTGLPAFRRVRRGVSLVPEGRGTLPGLSVQDNLELGFRARKHETSFTKALEEVFELFPTLGERLDQDCSTLSGGEMQMLAIGRSLLSDPKVLLLDEPSLGLAPQPVMQVYQALDKCAERGLTMILVEQKAVPLQTQPTLTLVLSNGDVLDRRDNERPSEQELASLYLGRTLHDAPSSD